MLLDLDQGRLWVFLIGLALFALLEALWPAGRRFKAKKRMRLMLLAEHIDDIHGGANGCQRTRTYLLFDGRQRRTNSCVVRQLLTQHFIHQLGHPLQVLLSATLRERTTLSSLLLVALHHRPAISDAVLFKR